MLKNSGIEFFPPVKSFDEAYKTYKECGGVIISLEEEGYLVDEVKKICKLYGIQPSELSAYFKMALIEKFSEEEAEAIINEWKKEEEIDTLKL